MFFGAYGFVAVDLNVCWDECRMQCEAKQNARNECHPTKDVDDCMCLPTVTEDLITGVVMRNAFQLCSDACEYSYYHPQELMSSIFGILFIVVAVSMLVCGYLKLLQRSHSSYLSLPAADDSSLNNEDVELCPEIAIPIEAGGHWSSYECVNLRCSNNEK